MEQHTLKNGLNRLFVLCLIISLLSNTVFSASKLQVWYKVSTNDDVSWVDNTGDWCFYYSIGGY